MIFGINQNLSLIGREFHVQTEVISGSKEAIRTTVYIGGKIIGLRETETPAFPESEDEIRELMRAQHDLIIGNMVRRMEEMVAAKTGQPPPRIPVPQREIEPAGEPELPAIDSNTRLLNSVHARRLLAPFWDIGKQPESTDPEKLRDRFGRLDELVSRIIASPIFPSLRVEEQVRFNILFDRIQAWLGASDDTESGLKLWSQVALFSRHISKINNRRELITFDRQMLRWAMHTITNGGLTLAVREQLHLVRGRDLELDLLLAKPIPDDKQLWLSNMQRILEDL